MNIQTFADYSSMSQAIADLIFKTIKNKPDLLLCTATGSTPTNTYDILSKEFYSKEPELFNKLRVLKLDEWGGIPMDDPSTCESYLREHLITPMNISSERFINWQSNPDDKEAELKRIKTALKKEGGIIDLCILGIGINGHLGFNEPGDKLHSEPHIATLSETTMQHSMLKVAKHTPTYGLTLGMADIMKSKMIILMLNGVSKQEVFKKLLTKELSTNLPASWLWTHPNVYCFCDKEVNPS